jgi:hypothetical protein
MTVGPAMWESLGNGNTKTRSNGSGGIGRLTDVLSRRI